MGRGRKLNVPPLTRLFMNVPLPDPRPHVVPISSTYHFPASQTFYQCAIPVCCPHETSITLTFNTRWQHRAVDQSYHTDASFVIHPFVAAKRYVAGTELNSTSVIWNKRNIIMTWFIAVNADIAKTVITFERYWIIFGYLKTMIRLYTSHSHTNK